MLLIQFKDSSKDARVEKRDGSYQRTFNRAEQPFQVTEAEWRILRREGLFELVKQEVLPLNTEAVQEAEELPQPESEHTEAPQQNSGQEELSNVSTSS